MKPDQERVRNLLTDTVTLLCKNGLQYQTELRVQGVLGITLDDSDVFIVHINEKFGDAIGGALTIRSDEGDAAKTLLGSTRLDARKSHDVSRVDTPTGANSKTREVLHRRRRRSRESSASPALSTNSSQQQILQRPIKRLMSSNNEASRDGSRNRPSLQNSNGSDSALPESEEVVEVKVKTEEDVIIVEQNPHDRTEMSGASQNIPHTTDQSAMQDSYPNLSLSELQGSYQPFGEILGVTDSSTNSGADGTAPPPIKRRATTGNTLDSFGGSSEMGPTPDVGGPFITGIMRNETVAGDVAPQATTATSWDPSQIPDFGSLTPQDSQMILDSTPGCSTWDTSQQSQVSVMRTPTSHTLQTSSIQLSESMMSRPPVDACHAEARAGAEGAQKYLCTYPGCYLSFCVRYTLVRHQRLKHGTPRSKPVYPRRSRTYAHKPFLCNYPGCSRSYFSAASLQHHQRDKHQAMHTSTET
ncbi:hypothetical protein LSAT2_010159 [Lamellibrachia satsuma]|nr:hypothetical protein LSAT2_010159 [Lamellibrachia satsuma]